MELVSGQGILVIRRGVFDPIVDTESTRYIPGGRSLYCRGVFDPIVDTERCPFSMAGGAATSSRSIRSNSGY